MGQLWDRIVNGASQAELVLLLLLLAVWVSHGRLVNDLRQEVKDFRRRMVERSKGEGDD